MGTGTDRRVQGSQSHAHPVHVDRQGQVTSRAFGKKGQDLSGPPMHLGFEGSSGPVPFFPNAPGTNLMRTSCIKTLGLAAVLLASAALVHGIRGQEGDKKNVDPDFKCQIIYVPTEEVVV